MRCASCGFETPEGMKFCMGCGLPFQLRCVRCGGENVPLARFCGQCGSPLVAQSPEKSDQAKSKAKSAPKSLTRKRRSKPIRQVAKEPRPGVSEAERRQLTVMFCDLVGSTQLSAQLDPEDYRAVVQQYQQTCTTVMQRHEGYLAQYLGDGLLVYFGYPTAHEDDARRAVRTGLEIVVSLRERSVGAQYATLIQVRIGIHTGLVVVGEIGSNEKRELLALGEAPNIAARIQGLAEPSTVFISAATQRLIEGQFESQPFGSYLVKGIDTPIVVYHVQSERQSVSPL